MSEKKSFAERTEGMTFGKKLGYIWAYYKLPIFAAIVAIILVVYGVYKVANPGKYTVLEAVMVNGECEETEVRFFDDFLLANEYDPADAKILVNTTYEIDMADSSEKNVTAYQMLYARFLGGDLDVVIADENVFAAFAEKSAFQDLTELMTEEENAKWAEAVIYLQDPETEALVPCGIVLEDTLLQSEGIYEGPVIAGIPHICGDEELTMDLLLYLLEK